MAGRAVAFPAEGTERRNYWVAICKVKDTCLKSVQAWDQQHDPLLPSVVVTGSIAKPLTPLGWRPL